MKEIIVVGVGPAGITAALYAKMAGVNATVLGKWNSPLLKAEKIKNYYGFVGGVSGKDLFNIGIEQAKELGIAVHDSEVLSIEHLSGGGYKVTTAENNFDAAAVILAMGKSRNKPRIQNLEKLEGFGVSYCAVCDGFFYKDKNIAILGSGDFAKHEYDYLKNLTESITILSEGEDLAAPFDKVIDKKITQLNGDERLNGVTFADGTTLQIDGLFIAKGSADSSSLAKKLGIIMEKGDVAVDSDMRTNLDGVYACGDNTGAPFQVAKGVYQGMVAGLAAAKFIKTLK